MGARLKVVILWRANRKMRRDHTTLCGQRAARKMPLDIFSECIPGQRLNIPSQRPELGRTIHGSFVHLPAAHKKKEERKKPTPIRSVD